MARMDADVKAGADAGVRVQVGMMKREICCNSDKAPRNLFKNFFAARLIVIFLGWRGKGRS